MKKCPFCAEEIKDEAIRCRYCQADLNQKDLLPEETEGTDNSENPVMKILDLISSSRFGIPALLIIIPLLPISVILYSWIPGNYYGFRSDYLFVANNMRLIISFLVILIMLFAWRGKTSSRIIVILFLLNTLLVSFVAYYNKSWLGWKIDITELLLYADIWVALPVSLIVLLYILVDWKKINTKILTLIAIIFSFSYLITVTNFLLSLFLEENFIEILGYRGGVFFLLTNIEVDILLKAVALAITYGSIYTRVGTNASHGTK